jgi:WD40 repeat protein
MLILKGPNEPIHALVFAPDATTLYAVHGYVGVHTWKLADRTVSGFDVGRRVFGEFVVHPGGRWAFGRRPSSDFRSDNDACLLDLTGPRARPFNFSGVVGQHVAISPDGSYVVTVGHSDWDKDRPAKTRSDRLYGWKLTATGPRYVWHRDTPEGAQPWRVVFVGNESLVSEDQITDGPNLLGVPRLCVRSATSGKPVRVIDSPNELIEQLLAAPDARQVVVRRGTMMWVYDPTDWKKRPTVVEGKWANFLEERAAAFHPSGRYLLLANNGPSVVVYDTATWEPVRKWKWDVGTLRAVAVSADGSLAAAAGPRGTAVVWDWDL